MSGIRVGVVCGIVFTLASISAWSGQATAQARKGSEADSRQKTAQSGGDQPVGDRASQAASARDKSAGTARKARGRDAADGRIPAQPSASDVINAFENDRPTNVPVRARKQGSHGIQTAGGEGLVSGVARLRDGQSLNDVVGRLVREGEWWTFVFESDKLDAPRPALRLLPNQQLERLVRETRGSSDSVVFVLSGEATQFENTNYLLVRKSFRRRSSQNLKK